MNTEKLTQSDDEELVLVNIIEAMIMTRVKDVIKVTDICQCKKCQLNVCAIALNSLDPKYVTTTKGALLASVGFMNSEYQMDVNVQISKAMKIVKECPLHDVNQANRTN